MQISKLYDPHEAKKLGFDEDDKEEKEECEEKMDREAWFEKYGHRE